ncbi:type IV toxin-antitoxin system AbiEi family antitoxin domain-containing protein [Microbacterium sp. ProA8]|uniref:type IV toxin-antitoxin system AbiEi family antitoxin domain-containing protein n=1 Tax=Microbacterium chionoecetis TaxID=3153754 RepID=UPI0032674FD6
MLQITETHLVARRRALISWIGRRHGVSHSSDARAAGFSRYEVAAAVDAGDLRRVRRSWLVTPECDRRRVVAASHGGRVTCVSAAAQLGLWMPPPLEPAGADPVHVAVPGTSSRHGSDGSILHWATGPAPTGRNMTEEPILNVLFHVAHCLPLRDALAVWDSAVKKGLTDAAVLRRVAWRRAAAAEIAVLVSSLSDSGLETRFTHGMRAAGVTVNQQVWVDGHPADGLIGESLVIQIDGFAHHSSAADRRRDLAADARLITRGYVVLRFDYQQILFDWDQVLDTVLTAIAQGAHRRPVGHNR